MVRITADLIRKKSEHNEGTMADLEEITLHQLEIERIENVGQLCRRLRILYLQNNIIGRIENLQHLKELEYLNLALNNITMIEGLESCEFLRKLDLTVNFIPLSNLEKSAQNLQHNKNLRELYVVGNPFSDWDGHKDFLVSQLPWLERLDGTSITKSDRIKASQRAQELKDELARLVGEELAKAAEAGCKIASLEDEGGTDENEHAPYTPELRTEMYREMAEEKAEKEAREKARQPKERDFDQEHQKAVEAARAKQFFPDGRVRQCNEAGLDFSFEEDKANFYLRVQIPRHVDTSLLDCQVYPRFVQVVFKDKTLRVAVPGGEDDEVLSSQSKCERSRTTGELKVTLPKERQSEVLVLGERDSNAMQVAEREARLKAAESSGRVRRLTKPTSLADQVLREAVDLRTIYQGKENPNLDVSHEGAGLKAISHVNTALERQLAAESSLAVPDLDDDDDED